MSLDYDYDKYEAIYNESIGTPKKDKIKCDCNKELVLEDYYLVCPSCGLIHHEQLILDYYSAIKIDKSYKRLYHLDEQLRNITASITVIISDELKQQIILLTNNNSKKLKQALRRLGLKKLYEKIPFIKWYIWQIDPPRISYNLYKQIINLYKKIEDEYFKLNLKRERFLLIHFVIYKILMNLNRPDIAKCIEKKSFKDTDEIWQKIKTALKLTY